MYVFAQTLSLTCSSVSLFLSFSPFCFSHACQKECDLAVLASAFPMLADLYTPAAPSVIVVVDEGAVLPLHIISNILFFVVGVNFSRYGTSRVLEAFVSHPSHASLLDAALWRRAEAVLVSAFGVAVFFFSLSSQRFLLLHSRLSTLPCAAVVLSARGCSPAQ